MPATKATLPPCPRCNRTKSVVKQGELFWCTNCRGLFDGIDEGGDYFDDPTKRIEVQERQQNRTARRT